jgi:hypothetical protein
MTLEAESVSAVIDRPKTLALAHRWEDIPGWRIHICIKIETALNRVV